MQKKRIRWTLVGLVMGGIVFGSLAAPIRSMAAQDEPSPDLILEAVGQGSADTDTFVTAGPVELCWQISGHAPRTNLGPNASFSVHQPDRIVVAGLYDGTEEHSEDCTVIRPSPGTYFVMVVASEWTSWHVTVRAL